MVLEVGYVLGVVLATLAAIIFAFQYICVRLGTDGGVITHLMLISLVTNVILAVPLVIILYGFPVFTPISVASFALAGIVGSMFARICVFTSVQRIGASRTAPIVAANVFVATILAVILFGETLSVVHFFGIVLIVGGIAVISWESAQDSAPAADRRDLGISLVLPVLAAIAIGIEPLFVSYGLAHGTAVLPGVAIKALTATIGFAGYLFWRGELTVSIFRWGPYMIWYLGAGVTSFVGIAIYFAALDVAPVVVVVPILQTAPLLVIAISALVLPQRLERVTWRLTLSAFVVVVGATAVAIT